MYNKALSLQQDGDQDSAEKIFKEIILKYPGTQIRRQIAYQEMKELYKKALHQFQKDIGRYPTTAEGLDFLCFNKSNLSEWDGPYLHNPKYNYNSLILVTAQNIWLK